MLVTAARSARNRSGDRAVSARAEPAPACDPAGALLGVNQTFTQRPRATVTAAARSATVSNQKPERPSAA